MTYKSIYLFLLPVILFFSCGNSNQDNLVESGKLKVVTTTGMLYDAVINIARDKVDAEAIMGPGVDPHLYKATQGDLSRINRADLVIYNGILLEGKMTEVLDKLAKQKPVLAAAEALPDSLLIGFSKYQGAKDPHVWFDVDRWKLVVKAISKKLQELDTTNATSYQSNTQAFLADLDSLNVFAKNRLSEIPDSQRTLITAHDAFGYFGNAYEIEVRGLQGISTVSDFGLRDIANVIDLILQKQIKAIFVETSVSDKSIQAVVTGCKEKGHDVVIGGYLYSDAMGALGTEEGTYMGMFRKNVNTIVDALK